MLLENQVVLGNQGNWEITPAKKHTFAAMLFRLRKYISVFALVVFLFPVVTEDLHAFAHGNDFHCTEADSKHIHNAEHHCAVCDFVPAVSDDPNFQHQVIDNVLCITTYFSFYKSIIAVAHNYSFSLRGPPAVSC